MTGNIEPKDEMIVKINNAMTPMDLVIPDNFTLEEAVYWANYFGNYHKKGLWYLGALLAKCEDKFGEMAVHVAEATGLDYGTLANAKSVYLKVFSQCREKLSYSHHQAVASLEPVYQDKYLKQAESEGLSHKELRSVIMRDRKSKTVSSPSSETFQILYANPPYQELGLKKILAIPVETMASEKSLLFLWTTSELLEDSLQIIKAWGFEYLRDIIWFKTNQALDYWTLHQHETLLIGKKGDFPHPDQENRPESIFQGSLSEEGKKPEIIFEMMEKMYPDMTKFNLFGECDRPGWKSLGN